MEPFAYVVNGVSRTVSMIDTAVNTVSTTIPGVLPQKIAITPDGAFAYLTTFADTISDI